MDVRRIALVIAMVASAATIGSGVHAQDGGTDGMNELTRAACEAWLVDTHLRASREYTQHIIPGFLSDERVEELLPEEVPDEVRNRAPEACIGPGEAVFVVQGAPGVSGVYKTAGPPLAPDSPRRRPRRSWRAEGSPVPRPPSPL